MSAVVKKSQVRLTEGPPAGGPVAAGGPQARLIEAGETEAQIEVICTCGRKVRVRCTYARGGTGL